MEVHDLNRNYKDKQRVLLGDVLGLKGFGTIMKNYPEAAQYDQRMLVMARPEDTLLVADPALNREWAKQLEGVGFGTRRIIPFGLPYDVDSLVHRAFKNPELVNYLKEEIESRGNGDPKVLTTYKYDYGHARLAEKLGLEYHGASTEQSDFFNNKVEFKKFLEKAGVKVMPGTVVTKDDLEKELLRAWLEYGHTDEPGTIPGTVYIRGEWGASGSANWTYSGDNLHELMSEIMEDEENHRYLVEPFYDIIDSPSQLMMIDDEEAYLLSPLSGQVLNLKKEWSGNFYERRAEPGVKELIADTMMKTGEAMRKGEPGYRGNVGLDFVFTEGNPPYPVEANARMTGANPPAHILSKLKERHDASDLVLVNYKIKMPQVSFTDLRREMERKGILYDGKDPHGVIFSLFLDNLRGEPVTELYAATVSDTREGLEAIVDETCEITNSPDTRENVFRAIRPAA